MDKIGTGKNASGASVFPSPQAGRTPGGIAAGAGMKIPAVLPEGFIRL